MTPKQRLEEIVKLHRVHDDPDSHYRVDVANLVGYGYSYDLAVTSREILLGELLKVIQQCIDDALTVHFGDPPRLPEFPLLEESLAYIQYQKSVIKFLAQESGYDEGFKQGREYEKKKWEEAANKVNERHASKSGAVINQIWNEANREQQ